MRPIFVQAFGTLVVFVAFTLLAGMMTAAGNILTVLLALAGAGVSASSFFGLKPWEDSEK